MEEMIQQLFGSNTGLLVYASVGLFRQAKIKF